MKYRPVRVATIAIATPSQVAIFSGTVEKEEIPSKAKLNSLRKRNLLSPWARSATAKGTLVARKPTQA